MATLDSNILARLLDDQLAMQRDTISNVLDTNTNISLLGKNVKEIHDFLLNGSRSSVVSALNDAQQERIMRQRCLNSSGASDSSRGTNRYNDYGRTVGEGVTKEIKNIFKSSGFGDALKKNIEDLSKLWNIRPEDFDKQFKGKIGSDIAKLLKTSLSDKGAAGKALIESFTKGTPLEGVGKGASKLFGKAATQASKVVESLGPSAGLLKEGMGTFVSTVKAGGTTLEGLAAAGPGLIKGVMGVATKLGPWALAIGAGIFVVNKFVEQLAPAIEGISEFVKASKAAADRTDTSAKENAKLAKQRLSDDVNTLVRQPFENLKKAADSVTSAFDNQLKVISATQGYTKADVQDLMSAYAQRLRSQGLTDIISGSDLINNLSKVIESGLSGKIAEEFAYQATILGNAIPTQNFFGYASTYSSIAANAIRMGKSQEEAISEANKSLSEFANNLLYASRELAGGYSTGLTNAQTLYEQSVKIAQAGRSGNIQGISGVMTSIAAIIGATAPDLANAITDAVYNAATGGNSSSIVALRSLAGINASNTEFIRALAANPQQVFSSLFNNLANMFNDSSDAYMEKAAGYAELFGLSPEAFQRIDFNYLAQAISEMNLSSAALNQNMELMVSGETTLTAEQLKNREINKFMLENGLSYVLDNEVARSIQEHMWDEQIARDLMEAQYGVNLQGDALKALVGIATTVKNILTFLNPIGALMKITNLVGTLAEGEAMKADIQQALVLGNVGKQNEDILSKYTTRNANLHLTSSYVSQLGGASLYDAVSSVRNSTYNMLRSLADPTSWNGGIDVTSSPLTSASIWSAFKGPRISSGYTWNTLGKSTSALIRNMLTQGADTPFGAFHTAAQAAPGSRAASIISDIINSSNSMEELTRTARSKGIVNVSEALKSAGFSESEVEDYYVTKQTQQSALEAEKYRTTEREFYSAGLQFFQEGFPEGFQEPLFETLEHQRSNTDALLKHFVDYFINHTYYDQALGGEKYYKQVLKVQAEEKSQKGDAVYALAEALTSNTTDLRDPALQTNAILSQILVVVNAIMQQNSTTGSAAGLADTLAALAMGGTYNT